MRLALSIELNCSRNDKQEVKVPFQEHVWTRSQVMPPPPYTKDPESNTQPGAGFSLVRRYSVNINHSLKSLKNTSEQRSRKARTSVRKLIRPMSNLFKIRQENSSRQLDYLSIEETPMQWDGVTTTDLDEYFNAHELAADRTVSELPGSSLEFGSLASQQINELDSERLVSELPGSHFEGEMLRSSQSIVDHPATTEYWNEFNDSNPVSSLTSPREASLHMSRNSNTQHFELDAGSQSRQSEPLVERTLLSGCQVSGRQRHGIPLKKETPPRGVMSIPGSGPPRLNYQSGYFEDRRRAGPSSEQAKPLNEVLNEDGEVPVPWESAAIQGPLIGMVESILYQLRPQGAKVLRMLEEGTEKVTKKWNKRIGQRWNGRGDLSEKDLPYFIWGWLSTIETSTVLSPRLEEDTERESTGQFQLPSHPLIASRIHWPQEVDNIVNHGDIGAGLSNRQPDLVNSIEQVNGNNTPREQGDIFMEPMMSLNHGSPSQIESSPRSTWMESQFSSPPMMNRRFSSMTSASVWTNDSIRNSSLGLASQMSTPLTEQSFLEEIFNFDHCRLAGCNARFSGDSFDIRRGNYTRHMKAKHGGERFYCDFCPNSYNRGDNLLNHKRKQHPEEDLPPPKRRRN